jgi:DNA-binding GntR family transcriptional regulator
VSGLEILGPADDFGPAHRGLPAFTRPKHVSRSESLSDQAYTSIKRLIVTLELAPEAVVDEVALQERLRVSRTPIREAIQRLAREQFVRVVPRRGVFVTSIEVGELATLFETRSVVEPYAARLAAERGDARRWDELAEVLGGLDTPTTAVDTLAVDRRCHELMWAGAQNRFLTDTLDMLYAQSERVWYLYLREFEMHDVLSEHAEMLDALREGNADRCEKLMAEHVKTFHDEIRSVAG